MRQPVFFPLMVFGLASVAQAVEPVTLLQQKCAACHGDSSGMSGLKLTSRESVLKGGTRGAAVVAGKAADSLLYKAVAGLGDVKMPPGNPLAPGEVQAIKDWIDGGAKWTSGKWWAFEKPVRPAVPAGSANPIDTFIDQKLKANGLTAAPQADRLSLIR